MTILIELDIAQIDKTIDALNRAIDNKPTCIDWIIMTDIKSIFEEIKRKRLEAK